MNVEHMLSKAMTTESVNKEELAETIASIIAEGHDSKNAYMTLYDVVYGDTLCKDECTAWVESMSVGNEHGQKWTVEEIAEIGNRIDVDFDKVTKCELWAATHYEYYTHKESLKKCGIPADNALYVRFGYDFINANDGDLKSVYFNVIK